MVRSGEKRDLWHQLPRTTRKNYPRASKCVTRRTNSVEVSSKYRATTVVAAQQTRKRNVNAGQKGTTIPEKGWEGGLKLPPCLEEAAEARSAQPSVRRGKAQQKDARLVDRAALAPNLPVLVSGPRQERRDRSKPGAGAEGRRRGTTNCPPVDVTGFAESVDNDECAHGWQQ